MRKKKYESVKLRIMSIFDETAIHSIRTSNLAKEFGKYLGLSDIECSRLEQGGILHDIGKYEITSTVLYKKGKLSESEYFILKSHVILAKKTIDYLDIHKDVYDIVLQHHERPDGNGYPYGLKSKNINKLAKIFSVIDVFDALSSVRCYKNAKSLNEVIEIINSGRGSQFDAKIVDKFIEFINSDKCKLNKVI